MQKILVIEDEAALRECILETLDCLGYEAVGAANGTIGINLAHQYKPDLIICDLLMPDMDGYSVLIGLRQMSETSNIKFIFLTSQIQESQVKQGLKLGANDYLTKPFTIARLREALVTQFENSKSFALL